MQLRAGRYTGSVLVFTLTQQQKQVIDHFRTCHLEHFQSMNVYTPYVFTLTPLQGEALKEKKGFSPYYFEVYETYRGYNDAGPHWNLALRISQDEVEVPLDLVIPDREAIKAHEIQGWQDTNPCFPELGHDRWGR